MIVVSIIAMVAAINLARGLVAPLGGWNAALVGGAVYLVVIAIAYVAMPSINEVPDGFPASCSGQFRTASFGMQLLLWTVIGLLFGALTERSLRRRPIGAALASAR